MKRLLLLLFTIATATVTDIDGNEYETVLIGDQLWMKENLKVTHYRNGDEIPTRLDDNTWASTEEGAYAIYDDDPSNTEVYGNLYNWYAVDDSRGICPEGWHVPSDHEFKLLEKSLGMRNSDPNFLGYRVTNEGSKLAGMNDLWVDGILKQNSEFGMSGFNALPAGCRFFRSGFSTNIGFIAYFWSSTEHYKSEDAYYRLLNWYNSGISRNDYSKRNGFSVRCLKD